VRLDLQAAGLGPRPPSVISSDQEYPPLEHKEIPVPSPYAKKLQQSEEIVSQSNTDCKTQSKPNTEVKNHGSTTEAMKINTTSTEDMLEVKVKSSDGVCQKTVSNAKNDQIKISVKEKIAKNREEVSGKRSSFVETESKDSVDKAIRSQEMNSFGLITKDSKDEEKYVTEVTKSEVSSRKECIAAVNSVLSRKMEKEVDQPQTTWEQEKQKAELAKLRLSENNQGSSLSPSTLPQRSVHSSKKSNDQSASESSQFEDSDSSDTKTITNVECVAKEMQNNSAGIAETAPKNSVNHITSVTPDTMTPDEAENLLSSR